MKRLILTLSFFTIPFLLFSQNENPYNQFGYEAPIMPDKKPVISDPFVFIVPNSDSASYISFLLVDVEKRCILLYNNSGEIIVHDTLLNYTLSRWLSTDPAHQYYSPYLGMGNNPVMGVDPDGAFWEELGNFMAYGYFISNEGLEALSSHEGAKYVGWSGSLKKGVGIVSWSDANNEVIVAGFRCKQDGFGSGIKAIWNGPNMRNRIPDMISLNVGVNNVLFRSLGGEAGIVLVTRGKSPGLYGMTVEAENYGAMVDMNANITAGNANTLFGWNVDPSGLEGKGQEISAGLLEGGCISRSVDQSGKTTWVTFSYGAGLTAGGRYSVTKTKLYPWFHQK